MALRDIRIYGDPVLRRTADEITDFGDELQTLAADMVETMVTSDDGVGLAAPQVGESKRLVVIGLRRGDEKTPAEILAMVNPEILEESEETVDIDEGCLSLPDLVVEDIERPIWIKVRFQKLDATTVELEADGMLARVMQHEMDHLDGVLIVDHVSPLKRTLLRGKLKAMEKMSAEQRAKAGS